MPRYLTLRKSTAYIAVQKLYMHFNYDHTSQRLSICTFSQETLAIQLPHPVLFLFFFLSTLMLRQPIIPETEKLACPIRRRKEENAFFPFFFPCWAASRKSIEVYT